MSYLSRKNPSIRDLGWNLNLLAVSDVHNLCKVIGRQPGYTSVIRVAYAGCIGGPFTSRVRWRLPLFNILDKDNVCGTKVKWGENNTSCLFLCCVALPHLPSFARNMPNHYKFSLPEMSWKEIYDDISYVCDAKSGQGNNYA